jgi:hypothetical protein
MIYFDSDMSKSTNTVVYFDWKTVIYIYVCGKCSTQFMLPMENSVTFISWLEHNIMIMSTLYKTNTWIIIVLAQRNNTQWVDMSLNSDTLS